jgi:hypothetical protein
MLKRTDNKNWICDADPVTVVAGATTSGIDAVIETWGRIRGRITPAAGGPLQGYPHAESRGSSVGQGYVDTNGDYQIDCLSAGSYAVFFEGDSHYRDEWYSGSHSQGGAQTVTVAAGLATTGIDATLDIGGAIAGQVSGAPGFPLTGDLEVRVLTPERDWVKSVHLDGTAGYGYTVRGLDPGDYLVRFNPTDNHLHRWYNGAPTHETAQQVEVQDGLTTTGIDAVLPPGGAIAGRVTDESGTVPVLLVDVDLHKSTGEEVTDVNESRELSGSYRLEGIPTGDYKVYFDTFCGAYRPEWWNDAATQAAADVVHVTEGSTVGGIDARLASVPAPGSIRGVVGIPGGGREDFLTDIYLYDAGFTQVLQTLPYDCFGRYMIFCIPPGTYYLKFVPRSGAWRAEWYNDAATQGTAIPIVVAPGQNLSGVDIVLNEKSAVNSPPVLAAIGDRTVAEGATLSFTATASDADIDPLTFGGSNLPAGAGITAGGLFTWTPGYAAAGTYPGVIISVSDGRGGSDSETITITVTDVNGPPVLDPIGNRSVSEGATLSFTATATDPDSDPLTFGGSNLPAGAGITAGGLFTWTPGTGTAGTYPNVVVSVSDGRGGTDSETITITVNPPNRDPVLNPIGNKTVAEGAILTFIATASDADSDPLTFSGSNLPAGAGVAPNGQFTWSPGYAAAGTYAGVVIGVADGKGGTDSETITITVTDVNRPPVLDPIGNRTVAEGATLTFTATATDPDSDPLTFSPANLPTGATLLGSGQFTWTPGFGAAGSYPNVTIGVGDGRGGTDSETITITVTNVNRAPVLDPIVFTPVSEGETLVITPTAVDPDSDPLAFTTGPLPEGAVFTTSVLASASAATLTWTPGYLQAGSYQIRFIVTDRDGASDDQVVDVVVGDTNPFFTDDFNDGSAAGDWKVKSGKWSVVSKRYVSSATRNNISLINVLGAGNPFSVGQLVAEVQLTAGKTPNGALIFALKGSTYRYAALKPGQVVIGQVGTIGGTRPGAWSKKYLPVKFGKYRLRVDVAADGTVSVWVGSRKVHSKVLPPVQGQVGLWADKAKTYFDNVSISDDSVLP